MLLWSCQTEMIGVAVADDSTVAQILAMYPQLCHGALIATMGASSGIAGQLPRWDHKHAVPG